jgi:hypothetical protein
MNQISTIVKNLKENNQDFEFYPTTDEILNCIKRSIGAVLDVGFTNRKSVLDIGAGRILGWIRNKEECKEEFNTDRYFNVMNNNQLLLGFSE